MADIGDKLRSAREAKGLSIADIEKATKIQGRYLTAIEQNEFDKLPGDFYVRAFIRQYAQVVGLDGKKLLSEYHQDIPKPEPDEYVEDSIDNKSEEVRKTTSNKKKIWKNYLPRVIVGLAVIVVILVCYAVYAHFSASHNQNANPDNNVSISSENTNKPKKKEKVAKTNPVKVREVAVNQFQVTGLKKNRSLIIRAGAQTTTVTISINGIRRDVQTLAADQKHSMVIPTDAQNVVVSFSNALDTKMTVGGKKVPYNPQSGALSITLIIGKGKAQTNSQSSSTTNTYHDNNSSTTNTNRSQTTRNNSQRQNSQTHSTTNSANNSQHSQSSQTNGQNTQNNNQSGTGSTNNSNQSNNSSSNNSDQN
ncbi:helix-turn-helix domain-containing protein [Lactobacillus sp. ESL0785]|uniref:helix-turn-helix domain-containing protein n=1 Tax=Lactobacillus sp. ESL0785 TaxID=2983232 RepID=UPI0023F83090|nr:helix-turn-helix domain-containing protein [Lactobacillus sp. ESL0785]WEV71368.1 helix-turn-helix domain-containing protein [Lactobacillus sp. ESL0785]